MTDDRPRVYLLHGLLETAYGHFAQQIRDWTGSFRLVPLDLTGHGRCPVDARPPYSRHNLDYVTTVVDRLGPGRFVAASYLGGPVAVRLARTRSDLVQSLVLTGFVPGVPQDVFAGWTRSIRTVSEHSAEMAAAYDATHGPRWRSTLAEYASDVDERYADAIEVRPGDLGELGLPVLLVNGSEKSAERGAAAGAHELGALVSGRVIDGAGHIPGRDKPAGFDAAVREFWVYREVADANA